MSDEELPIRFADAAQAAMDASKSAGQLLREAREAQGLHVAALAVSLKVPVKKLEALEADRLEELPDAVFVRALASSVCRALKIQPGPVLEKLPQLNTRVLDQVDSGMNVAFRSRADSPAPSALGQLNRPVVLGVMALLLAAIVLMMLPDFSSRASSSATSSAAPNAASAAANSQTAGVSIGSGVNVAATPAANATSTTAAISPSPNSNQNSNQTASTTSQESATLPTLSVTHALSTPSVSSPTLTISVGSTPPAPPPADAVVLFTATGETWIEVKDAGGKIILQRTLLAGEKAGVGPSTGKLPFSVIVGRANLTQVSVRGKAFDLAPVSSKEAVARFQVK
jgi:cytoskeleton protein RodZ